MFKLWRYHSKVAKFKFKKKNISSREPFIGITRVSVIQIESRLLKGYFLALSVRRSVPFRSQLLIDWFLYGTQHWAEMG